ncbi:MAG: DivIVA domain-containing protein [Firmicutes bacterium]|nr:DivIVA domain-containing protein [Bacillota bacterium]MBQ3577698.1 DivIVA domain-containing protein [Bacillota bacterium]MBQ4181549.1 DivIVA domain-containing protein [Bacillota bacterium]MBQ4233266.1 DivIVA domain-containing protein [Bacillota bacterium]MBQ5437885.1 DivIVA domain-containing protein [Bacillota bacterium]
MLPSEIQGKTFSRAVRGYKEDEVDQFLELLADEFASLISDNDRLRLEVEDQNRRISGYKQQESSIASTLEAAKSLMSDISASAEKRAEILIKNAELDAEIKQRQAMDAVQRLKDEEQSLSERVNMIRTRFKSMLEAELARFDSLSDELFTVSAEEGGSLLSHRDTADIGISSDPILEELDAQAEGSARPDPSRTLTNFRRPL